MPRSPRQCPGGHVYHVWNRAAGRLRLFKKDADYEAFERVMVAAHGRHPVALLDWCLMPNHWHLVLSPEDDGQVTAFVRWLTHTHAMRAGTHRRVLGTGPLYQGRFKSLPVQDDLHLLMLLRYVERNPVRAGLVSSARDWRWGSAGVRARRIPELTRLLADWPVDRPIGWSRLVDEPQTAAEQDAIRQCVRRSRPFGDEDWARKTADKLGLESTFRPRGRPRRGVDRSG